MACKVLFQEISYTELKLRHSSFTCMGCCIVNITIQSLTRYLTFKSGLLDILIIWNNKLELCVGGNNEMYSSNPRRVGIYKSYTWASIHMGSIYTNMDISISYYDPSNFMFCRFIYLFLAWFFLIINMLGFFFSQFCNELKVIGILS